MDSRNAPIITENCLHCFCFPAFCGTFGSSKTISASFLRVKRYIYSLDVELENNIHLCALFESIQCCLHFFVAYVFFMMGREVCFPSVSSLWFPSYFKEEKLTSSNELPNLILLWKMI